MKIKTNQELLSRSLTNKIAFYNPKTDGIVELNLTAATVIEKCETPQLFDELIVVLNDKYPNLEKEETKWLFAPVIKNLLKKGFLELIE